MSVTVLVGALTVSLACTCWYAGEKGARYVFALAKVTTMVALLAFALMNGALRADGGIALLVGLFFGLLGDAALLRRDSVSFTLGLAAFLVGHIAYVVAFSSRWWHLPGALTGLLLVLPFAVLSFPRVLRTAMAAEGGRMGAALSLYTVVIASMAVAAGATGNVVLLLGGLCFVISDMVLALDRFAGHRGHAGLVVMVFYHLAQFSFVTGMLIVSVGS